MESRMREREINVIDMFLYVLLKWRILLLVGVVLAVMAAGYSYMKSAKQVSEQKQQESQEIVLTGEKLLEAERYLDYFELYGELSRYNAESPLMQLEANSFYETEVEYYISMSDKDAGSKQYALALSYEGILQSEAFVEKLRTVLGDEISENYYNEIVNVDKTVVVTNSSISDEEAGAGTVRIIIRLNDEEKCRQIGELVCTELEEAQGQLGQLLGGHTLTLLKNTTVLRADSDVFIYQQARLDKLKECKLTMTTLRSELSSEQFAYSEQRLREESEFAEEELLENKDTITAGISGKLVVAGFAAGIFLSAVCYILIYLFNGCLQIEDDIEKIYDMKLLACISAENSNKKKLMGGIDCILKEKRRKGVALFEEQDAFDMIIANIQIACEKSGIKKLAITRNGNCRDEAEFAQKLAEKLEKQGIEVFLGNTILYDYETLQKTADATQIVLVEHAGKTGYLTIQREIDACIKQGTNIIGAVVLE